MDTQAAKPVTFLSLPLEIRILIYKPLLVKPTPIVVWSAEMWQDLTDRYFLSEVKTNWDRTSMSASRRGLHTSLLRVSQRVSAETSSLFYNANTFCFRGDHDWLCPLVWLRTIGSRNRAALANLIVSVPKPTASIQRSDGSRAHKKTFLKNGYYQRNAAFSNSSEHCQTGLVENINPILETFIAALAEKERSGRRQEVAPILLTLELRCDLLPGVVLFKPENRLRHESSYFLSLCRDRACNLHFSMDMPNLIEHWRMLYTGEDGRPLSIAWKVETEDAYVNEKREMLEEKDWKILEEGRCEKVWPWDDTVTEAEQHPPKRYVQWTLERNKLTGPLIATEPPTYRRPQEISS